ncbi:MAG: hypothetical protein PHO76_09255 [Methylotenera sp.]|jgi:hypothetical protein|nr:hypothetical protein [Methylotenera sp.]MDD4925948.1 hypothetical protein [Methylotenera sp.]
MTRLFFVVLGLTLALTGCGGGPGDSDVKTAIEKKIFIGAQQRYEIEEMTNRSLNKLREMRGQAIVTTEAPKQEDIKIDYINIEDKKELENGDYTLKVTIAVKDVKKDKTSEKISARLTMSHVDKEWRIVKEEPIN